MGCINVKKGKRGGGIHGQMKNKERNEEKELGKCTVKRGNKGGKC